MSDYREITLADAWKRIGYGIGRLEVAQAVGYDEPPNVDSAFYLVEQLSPMHYWRKIEPGITDAIRDSQPPA